MAENLYYHGFVEGYATAAFIALYTQSSGVLLFGLSCIGVSILIYNLCFFK